MERKIGYLDFYKWRQKLGISVRGSLVRNMKKSIPKAVVIDNRIRKSFGKFMTRICRDGLDSPKFVAKEPTRERRIVR